MFSISPRNKEALSFMLEHCLKSKTFLMHRILTCDLAFMSIDLLRDDDGDLRTGEDQGERRTNEPQQRNIGGGLAEAFLEVLDVRLRSTYFAYRTSILC